MSYGGYGYGNMPVLTKPGGRRGRLQCWVEPDDLRGKWYVVVWDGDKAPSLYKGKLLVLSNGHWREEGVA